MSLTLMGWDGGCEGLGWAETGHGGKQALQKGVKEHWSGLLPR
jgi:hypothetical protein